MTTSLTVKRAVTFLSSMAFLGLGLTGCPPSQSPQVSQETAAPPQAAAPQEQTDPFGDAVNKATDAAQRTQEAKTPEEWAVVAALWEEAIALMKSVPAASPNYQTAQKKAGEYQANFAYARRYSPQQKPVLTQRASQISNGMTYKEIVALLGRMPDTAANDAIRQELGEPVQGHNLITLEWRNDNPHCFPVAVQFDPQKMTVTGWSDGSGCDSAPGSIFNEPFGKPCSETALCKLR